MPFLAVGEVPYWLETLRELLAVAAAVYNHFSSLETNGGAVPIGNC